MILRRRALVGAIAAASVPCSMVAAQARFVPLGDLPGGEFRSGAYDVSDDGRVIVGTGLDAGTSAFRAVRWTDTGPIEPLNPAPGQGQGSIATGVSGDGSVVVGNAWLPDGPRPVRWDSSGVYQSLGSLIPGGGGGARAVGADGRVIVGTTSNGSTYVPFVWTEASGIAQLPLPGWAPAGIPDAVSADGRFIAGQARNNFGAGRSMAVRWSPNGYEELGYLPGGTDRSNAGGISADGMFVVGASDSSNGTEAFRWSESTGMVGLGDLPGGDFLSSASDVTDDGRTIVGWSVSKPNFTPYLETEAFIWIESRGMLSLKSYMGEIGITGLEDWTLLGANAVSGDGRVIVGTALNPQNREEAFAVFIPSPHGLGLLLGWCLLAPRPRNRA